MVFSMAGFLSSVESVELLLTSGVQFQVVFGGKCMSDYVVDEGFLSTLFLFVDLLQYTNRREVIITPYIIMLPGL